jgi:hypothetical protein
LYDPRNPELLLLLDTDHSFPTAAISEDELALSMLGQLGLRSSATPDTILEAANLVQAMADSDAAGAVTRGKVHIAVQCVAPACL